MTITGKVQKFKMREAAVEGTPDDRPDRGHRIARATKCSATRTCSSRRSREPANARVNSFLTITALAERRNDVRRRQGARKGRGQGFDRDDPLPRSRLAREAAPEGSATQRFWSRHKGDIMKGEQQSGRFETIVLALDGSEGSRRGIPFARELARQGGGRVVIAHVREQVVTRGGGAPPHEDEIQASIAREAEEISQQGIKTNVEIGTIVLGGPAHAINEIADGAGADLIIIGTRGHSPVAGLVLGSVTLRLLHIAKCPVLAVPPGVTPELL